jgi:hypothetical protein
VLVGVAGCCSWGVAAYTWYVAYTSAMSGYNDVYYMDGECGCFNQTTINLLAMLLRVSAGSVTVEAGDMAAAAH